MTTQTAHEVLDRFLRTDPADAGCQQAIATLHAYVELAAAGEQPDARYPGIGTHLRACAPCGDDYDGLLITVVETDRR